MIEFNHLSVYAPFLLPVGCVAMNMVRVWVCVGLWVIYVFVPKSVHLHECGCVQTSACVSVEGT